MNQRKRANIIFGMGVGAMLGLVTVYHNSPDLYQGKYINLLKSYSKGVSSCGAQGANAPSKFAPGEIRNITFCPLSKKALMVGIGGDAKTILSLVIYNKIYYPPPPLVSYVPGTEHF